MTEAIFETQETGFSLRDRVRARFPQTRVLFSTRYDLTGFEDQIADGLVLKDAPYTPEKLLDRVRALLSLPVESDEPTPVMVPGTVLGNYQVLERLYIEKEAETYRALQITVQRPVALVLLKPEYLKQPDVVAKFKERERVKASLMHPRIAPLYEAGETNGWLFYTRELPRGRSLSEIELTNEMLSERRLAEVLFGVAEAMQFATERGYHHRSISPRDIYIDADHQSSIVNFFRPAVAKKRDAQADVKAFLDLMRQVAAEGKSRGLLQSLADANHDWNGLLNALDDVRDDMRERSIVRKIEAESMPVSVNGTKPWSVCRISESLENRCGGSLRPFPATQDQDQPRAGEVGPVLCSGQSGHHLQWREHHTQHTCFPGGLVGCVCLCQMEQPAPADRAGVGKSRPW